LARRALRNITNGAGGSAAGFRHRLRAPASRRRIEPAHSRRPLVHGLLLPSSIEAREVDMTAEGSETRPGDSPLAELERALIEEFVRDRGFDPHNLADLGDAARERLLKDASVYASVKLMEVEARSRLLHDIHV
jgi:hypothetical protein